MLIARPSGMKMLRLSCDVKRYERRRSERYHPVNPTTNRAKGWRINHPPHGIEPPVARGTPRGVRCVRRRLIEVIPFIRHTALVWQEPDSKDVISMFYPMGFDPTRWGDKETPEV